MQKNEKYIMIGGSFLLLAALGITAVVVSNKLNSKKEDPNEGITADNFPAFGSGTLKPQDFGVSIGQDIEAIKLLELRKVLKIDGVWTNDTGSAVFNPGDRIGEIHSFQRDYYDPSKLWLIMEERGFNWFNPEYYRLDVKDLKI